MLHTISSPYHVAGVQCFVDKYIVAGTQHPYYFRAAGPAFPNCASQFVQAQLVSKELIRVAILWHEMWHEALEEASRLYFGERNVEAMFNCLQPLHVLLANEGPVTVKEQQFVQSYGRELAEAYECCMKYQRTGKEAELTQVRQQLTQVTLVSYDLLKCLYDL